jgi:beta-N-acetylhexosaminidase
MNDLSPGQLLLVGLPGPELDSKTAAILRRVQPGGFILFTRNIRTPEGLRKLTDDLRDLSQHEPIITIDQEGGRVSRLKAVGHEPPGATQFRALDNAGLVARHGRLTARLLRLFGFNLDLCPVLDLCLNGDETVDNSLRGRCYGETVEQTVRLAGAFNDALRAGGIASCGKHFPGYTCARNDAHHELPVIDRSRAELDATELAPYREMGARLDSVMVCHAHYPSLDPQGSVPASLSRNVITGLLREELGYRGLVMTDDLDMGAILNDYALEETLHLALAAGADMAMICHRVDQLENARAILESLPAAHVERALAAVASAQAALAAPEPVFSIEAFHALDAEVWDLRVQVMGEEAAARRSPEDGKRSPVEIY